MHRLRAALAGARPGSAIGSQLSFSSRMRNGTCGTHREYNCAISPFPAPQTVTPPEQTLFPPTTKTRYTATPANFVTGAGTDTGTKARATHLLEAVRRAAALHPATVGRGFWARAGECASPPAVVRTEPRTGGYTSSIARKERPQPEAEQSGEGGHEGGLEP